MFIISNIEYSVHFDFPPLRSRFVQLAEWHLRHWGSRDDEFPTSRWSGDGSNPKCDDGGERAPVDCEH